MKRIATTNAVADLFGAGKAGFRNGNKAAGVRATDLDALWCNHLQEAIIRTIEAAGLELSDVDFNQFVTAQQTLFVSKTAFTNAMALVPKAYSILDLPDEDVGMILVVECAEIWLWSTSAYFTGYRSPLCGRPIFGHTLTPLISEVDAVGGTVSKTDYARVWGYAQENGLVVASANWVAGAHHFVDVDANNLRLPDLRNQFLRMTGTDADTANARTLGSRQKGSIIGFDSGPDQAGITILGSTRPGLGLDVPNISEYSFIYNDAGAGTQIAGQITVAGVARPVNTAFSPRIHV